MPKHPRPAVWQGVRIPNKVEGKNTLRNAARRSEIYGKTGTGTDGTAWFIGFVEKENTNIYFAIYLDDDSSNEISGIKAQEIAFNILEE